MKLLRSTWNIVDVTNRKFVEMLDILGHLFDHLSSQAPNSEAYDALTRQLNTDLRKVFIEFDDLKDSLLLAPVPKATDARGGEGSSEPGLIQPWKLASVFQFRHEDLSSDDEVQVFYGLGNNSDDDEDNDEEKYVTKGFMAIGAPRKIFPKQMTEEEKRIWPAVSWPSSLPYVLQRGIQIAKAKSFLTS